MEGKRSHNFLWFLTITMAVFGTNISLAAITNQPPNTAATTGDTNIVLQCNGNQATGFFWTFTKFTTDSSMIADTVLTNQGAAINTQSYAIQINTPDEFSLIIKAATVDMSGTYRCINKVTTKTFILDDGDYPISDIIDYAIVVAQVIVTQSDPKCAPGNVNSDGSVQLTCTISYSGGSFQNQLDPAYPTSSTINPIFTWTTNGQSAGVGTTGAPITSISLVTVVSTLTVNSPSAGQSFTCSVTFGPPTNPMKGVATNAPTYNKMCSTIPVTQ